MDQEGEGIVDVTTHLVDLIQCQCFPEIVLDYKKDINMVAAKHWATVLTPSQFCQVTKKDTYPDFLKKDVKDSLLSVYANGEMNYELKIFMLKYRLPGTLKFPGVLVIHIIQCFEAQKLISLSGKAENNNTNLPFTLNQ